MTESNSNRIIEIINLNEISTISKKFTINNAINVETKLFITKLTCF